MINKIKDNKRQIGLFLFSVLLILIFSKSSPLYAFNDSNDVNCFMTIGNGIKHGLMPYKNLFDHKGPIFLFIFGIINLISETSFIGVFLIEVIACYFTLYFTDKIFKEYKTGNILYSLIFGALIYTARSFGYGGQCVEEFALPIMLYLMLIGIKYVRNSINIKNRQYFIIGMLGAIIMWSKYSLLGFFIGWYVVLLITFIKRKNYRAIKNSIIFVGLGVISVSTIVILVLYILGIFNDCINIYFIENIFKYGNSDSILLSLSKLFKTLVYYNFPLFLLMIASLITAKSMNFIYWIFPNLIYILIAFKPAAAPPYTIFPMFMLIIPLLVWVSKRKTKICFVFILMSLLVINIAINNNIKDINRTLSDYPTYQLTKDIKGSNSLINFGLEKGYFFLSNTIPKHKYFYQPLYTSRNQINFQEADNTAQTNPPTYIIRNVPVALSNEYKFHEIITINDYSYKKIKTVEGKYNNVLIKYCLYKLNND